MPGSQLPGLSPGYEEALGIGRPSHFCIMHNPERCRVLLAIDAQPHAGAVDDYYLLAVWGRQAQRPFRVCVESGPGVEQGYRFARPLPAAHRVPRVTVLPALGL